MRGKTCASVDLKRRSRVVFGLVSADWLKKLHEFLEPMTKRYKGKPKQTRVRRDFRQHSIENRCNIPRLRIAVHAFVCFTCKN